MNGESKTATNARNVNLKGLIVSTKFVAKNNYNISPKLKEATLDSTLNLKTSG